MMMPTRGASSAISALACEAPPPSRAARPKQSRRALNEALTFAGYGAGMGRRKNSSSVDRPPKRDADAREALRGSRRECAAPRRAGRCPRALGDLEEHGRPRSAHRSARPRASSATSSSACVEPGRAPWHAGRPALDRSQRLKAINERHGRVAGDAALRPRRPAAHESHPRQRRRSRASAAANSALLLDHLDAD